MEIKFLHPRFDRVGGAESVICILAKELLLRGHVVKIITKRGNPSLEKKYGIPMRVLFNRIRFNGLSKKHGAKLFGSQLVSLLKEGDIICANNHPSHWWMEFASKLCQVDIKKTIFCHEPYRPLYFLETDKNLITYISQNDRILSNDTSIRKKVRIGLWKYKLKMNYNKRKLDSAIMHCSDLTLANSMFTSRIMKSVWNVESHVCYPSTIYNTSKTNNFSINRKGIVFFTSPIITKNLFGIMDTICILQKNRKNRIPIHIVGNILTRRVNNYIRKRNLTDIITLHGFVSEKQKHLILKSVRMCIYIPFDEPFGLVPIESLSCGTPVVVSNLGGFTEVIKNGETGIYVNPFNPQEIAEVISTYYGNIPKLNAMSKAGLELVQKNHLVKHFVDTFESYLEEVVSN